MNKIVRRCKKAEINSNLSILNNEKLNRNTEEDVEEEIQLE